MTLERSRRGDVHVLRLCDGENRIDTAFVERFGEALRARVAETVGGEQEVEAELADLLASFGGSSSQNPRDRQ